jgi:serine/threonine protein kinase
MGEVYRATDTNLGRDVAIKVLPAALAQDVDRLARFEREARTLASLNHPNIAIIHGLERSQGTIALVMELVEGGTLADRIASGPIRVDDALPIARQIAEALEAAHEQGIVHRDLKPANIKVRPDGTVKVLDFGLAKAMEASTDAPRASSSLSLSPTITTPAMTQMGVILGTAAYMSPEQARGGQADRRTDIWAFGCLVYEMLTGRAAFDGGTVSDVLAAVLRADAEWTRLPQAIHPRVRSMIERCLAREMRNRYQGIGDARVDIETALGDPTGAVFDAARTEHVAVESVTRQWAVWAAIAVVAAALGAGAARALSRPVETSDNSALRFSISPPGAALFDAFDEGVPLAMSPNGRTIAVVVRASTGVSQLWLQSLDAERLQPIQGTEGAAAPFWSPDSEWIGFYAGGNLKKISIALLLRRRRRSASRRTIAALASQRQSA